MNTTPAEESGGTARPASPGNRRSIILAGGDGERTRPFIERWLGYHNPKQFCAFVGTRTLFQHTVDRADRLAPIGRAVVVARDRVETARAQLAGRSGGRLLAQPSNRGTAPGLLLPLTCVGAHDPDATVIVYPSDHFVYPEDRFVAQVAMAARHAEALPDRIVLLGVAPDAPEPDYGWIVPGAPLGGGRSEATNVERFVEKPSMEASKGLMRGGALCNTLIAVGKVRAFWRLACRFLPDVMALFTYFQSAIGTPREAQALQAIYEVMPKRDFSRHVLQRAPGELALLPLRNVLWSDWGRPERIAETIERIGREPAFPVERALASA